MRSLAATALAVVALASSARAGISNPIDSIVIKGAKFFYGGNGTQFYMRGVAYQQDYSANGTSSDDGSQDYKDPLADPNACKRDIPLLAQLRTNVIRVYAVDPTQNHDPCMQMLNDAGIYVIADLSQPDKSINRDSPSWNDDLYARYTSVVDNLAGYSNVLGFFAGNEVSNAPNNTQASAFVKAAVRDTKAYIKEKKYRTIGVGYATNDDAAIRVNMANYFNCGNQDDAIDFWGYNIYSWCGDSSYTESGYDVRTKEFSTYSVPFFFAEYGCNTPSPRNFTEVGALYGPQMNGYWSGGIVYMYFQEANDYGLVSVSGNSVSKLPDFTNLQKQIAKATPTGVNAAQYQPSNSPAACPPLGKDWAAPSSPLPPTPNKQLCSCMVDTLQCVAKPDLMDTQFGQLFGTVCGLNGGSACAGINTNASNGAYGAYGMCNPSEQLSFAFNAYYQSQKKAADACNFGGAASTKASTNPTSACSSLLQQAGAAGTGAVTSRPSGAAGGSGTGTKGAASPLSIHHVSLNGVITIGAYLLVAVFSGAAMLLL